MPYSVFRVNDYIKNGMDKDVVDPDGGVNLSKKRKILGVAEVVDPEINENFPSSGFQCGIALLPRISFSHIWKYLIEEVELRRSWQLKSRLLKVTIFINLATFDKFFQKEKGINCSLKASFSHL